MKVLNNFKANEMNQTHQSKFYFADSISIQKLDNFFLNKSAIKPESNREAILFSDFINKNKCFAEKLLLNIFPQLVEEILEKEFERKLDTDLINILVKDFKIKAFENFSAPSKQQKFISSENKAAYVNYFIEEKALDKANSHADLRLR